MSTLAWARHLPSGQIRHISAARRGLACESVCPGCGATLEAVNPQNPTPLRRMHFRHHAGAEQTACLEQAARAAIRTVLSAGAALTLPDYEFVATGRNANGATVRVSQQVSGSRESIARLDWVDEVSGLVELADGRKLTVKIVVGPAQAENSIESSEASGQAELHVLVNDPELAALAPDELLRRMSLDTSCSRWVYHWQTAQLASAARAELAQRIDAYTPARIMPVTSVSGAPPSASAQAAGVHWRQLAWAASRQVTEEHVAAAIHRANTICLADESSDLKVDELMAAFDAAIAARRKSERADDWLSTLAGQRGEAFARALAEMLISSRVAVMHQGR